MNAWNHKPTTPSVEKVCIKLGRDELVILHFKYRYYTCCCTSVILRSTLRKHLLMLKHGRMRAYKQHGLFARHQHGNHSLIAPGRTQEGQLKNMSSILPIPKMALVSASKRTLNRKWLFRLGPLSGSLSGSPWRVHERIEYFLEFRLGGASPPRLIRDLSRLWD